MACVIRVLVVADVRLYREGVADVLQRQEQLAVVGTAKDPPEGIVQARELRPDVVVMDLTMHEGPGAVRELTTAVPGLRVVALSVSEEPDEVIAWVEAGISAYVTPDGSIDDLTEAIVAAVRDELRCSNRIAAALRRRVTALAAGPRDPPRATARLTRREREIVALIDEGLGNKEIATRLQIELPTVKNHVHHIIEKLGARGRSEAAWLLRQQELRRPIGTLP
jgi:two-component system nitrate/nitrite response regulator NarL